MDDLNEKIEELSVQLKEIKALLLAFAKTADMEPGKRQTNIKTEYIRKARKLGISLKYPD